jgi:hypothetical protein
MGIADKFKKIAVDNGLWEKKEQEDSDDDNIPVPRPKTGSYIPFSTIPVTAIASPVASAIVNPDTVKVLTDAIGNTQNTAYTQFKTVFDALAGLPDPQRYPAALNAVAATNKISAQDVLKAFAEREKLLANEQHGFEAAMVDANEQTVVAVVKQVEQITATIDAKKKEIETLVQQQQTLAQQIQQAQMEITNERASFEASFTMVQNQLATERKNFETYIKTT